MNLKVGGGVRGPQTPPSGSVHVSFKPGRTIIRYILSIGQPSPR